FFFFFFFFQAEDGIRDGHVTGVQTCALPIFPSCENVENARAKSGLGFTSCRTGASVLGSTATSKPPRYEKLLSPKSWFGIFIGRSEERRVGKECRWRWGREDLRQKDKKMRCR